MRIVLIKYNAGNIQSVLNALQRLGAEAEVTDSAESICSADKVIFPGVGHAKSAMQSLNAAGLNGVIKDLKQPVLGIRVGMQLLCAHSEEEDTEALGIIPVQVKRFAEGKVPQVGWNTIHNLRTGLFKNIPENSYIYNVHSYYAEDSAYTIANCTYGVTYAAAVKNDNFYGVQFHTEKAQPLAIRLLKIF